MHALLTLRTVRHLWLSQVLWRLKYRRLRRREEATRYGLAGRLRRKTAGLTRDPQFLVTALAAQLCSSAPTRWHDGRLTLLHRERPFAGGDDWCLPRAQIRDRLWMAHLHGHRWLLDLANRNAPGGGKAAASGEALRRVEQLLGFPIHIILAGGPLTKSSSHYPDAKNFLKPVVSFTQLDTIANTFSDNEAAQRLNAARNILFQSINRRSKQVA